MVGKARWALRLPVAFLLLPLVGLSCSRETECPECLTIEEFEALTAPYQVCTQDSEPCVTHSLNARYPCLCRIAHPNVVEYDEEIEALAARVRCNGDEVSYEMSCAATSLTVCSDQGLCEPVDAVR